MKVCPFCELQLDEDKIKGHIGSEHLGINVENEPIDFENELEAVVKLEIIDVNEDRKISTVANFQCDDCEKHFLSESSLEKHCGFVHQSSSYKCRRSNPTITSNDCKLCRKTFTSLGSLHRHIQSIHDKFQYECEKCEKTFTQKYRLTEHVKVVHEGSNHNYCKFAKCKKSFSNSFNLKQHIQYIHEKSKPKIKRAKNHNCDKCEKRFQSKASLNEHNAIVPNPNRTYSGLYSKISRQLQV